MPNPLTAPLLRRLGRLGFPRLFLLTAALFVVNIVVPDPIPFVDEILLGLATLLLASWKRPETDARSEDKAARRR